MEEYLQEWQLDPDPLEQLLKWYKDAQHAESEPEAMALATADARARPSVRFVLLRWVDARGLVFFTNYESRKGRDLAQNPRAAAVLYWPRTGRQARAEGAVEKVDPQESQAYFSTRPRENRLAAVVSPQSQVIPGRSLLDERFHEAERQFEGREIPCPPFWGGYRLSPDYVELWQRADHRLHDRFAYRREGGVWILERLAP
jgi:pyridoxamine 5'-phosphate oxidase